MTAERHFVRNYTTTTDLDINGGIMNKRGWTLNIEKYP